MGVDHRRLDALVTQQLLHGPDVIAVQEQVGGEGVPQSVTACMLGDACLVLGLVEGPLEISFMQMVPATLSRPRIPKQRGSRKGVALPSYRGPSGRISWTALEPRAMPWA